MFAQALAGLRISAQGTYLDGTFGRGGHARGVLEQLGAGGRLLLMDKDPDAIAVAEREFGADERVAIFRGSFADLLHWDATAAGLDGVLLDLGVSSPQLDVAERGFSFGKDGPLDMRMDPESGESAAQWLAHAGEQDIANVLWTYGEERMSRRIARAIVARREAQPLTRTAQLAEMIASVMPRVDRSKQHKSIHPATRSFQAIRIHINRELADLETGLDAALQRLKPGGRLAVISFHSLEDRIVKQFIARHAKAPPANRRLPEARAFVPALRMIGAAQKAVGEETASNPRARSAVLRVAEKLGTGDQGPGTRVPQEQQPQSAPESRNDPESNSTQRHSRDRGSRLTRVPGPGSPVPVRGAKP
ncbi:16S rRNA (cytosine(1402)-N(4))-methyltransferase RsmH [Lysobacter sp. D1-1-M9]|uniref:16S rRNA (cytosine(1402)-N(4))-methyltransferase RsmH n=1 Tax=Novilysobacter longmucuonensis TaxID=3098603 RepID=UPI002FC7C5FC